MEAHRCRQTGPAALADVVDKWGARRIVMLRERGEEIPQIAARLVTSVSTVKRTLDHARSNNRELRVPQQGKGKTDDPRWIFAGPRGPGNLYHLECTMDASDARRELRLVHEQVDDEMEDVPAYSTMTEALRKKLDFTRKQVCALPCHPAPAHTPVPPSRPSPRLRALLQHSCVLS